MALKPIKHCGCYPVLPTIYDDALSYEEQLCKLIAKMNEIIKFANGELIEQLKQYINQMFNDMMINAIYDEPTETITLRLEMKDNG